MSVAIDIVAAEFYRLFVAVRGDEFHVVDEEHVLIIAYAADGEVLCAFGQICAVFSPVEGNVGELFYQSKVFRLGAGGRVSGMSRGIVSARRRQLWCL